ncbi:MAG: hypothetical protein UT23_C0021G0014 [Candidatus Woesebacteria bacterium GW2011_GWA1_39_12]|uniref:Uncharacterized protein n=1 Tax=Candidatus Woesebacteria bacterium GW2011_GWA1_39_12 TaxID=1618549 RepID=A0A0G0Q5I7_9BACT|nr:MAG: hypothetical protein UT23_C0021G0014 [Candidatus Woesebacteria bacterium GW2011_GWA1_39_12]
MWKEAEEFLLKDKYIGPLVKKYGSSYRLLSRSCWRNNWPAAFRKSGGCYLRKTQEKGKWKTDSKKNFSTFRPRIEKLRNGLGQG